MLNRDAVKFNVSFFLHLIYNSIRVIVGKRNRNEEKKQIKGNEYDVS